MSLLSSLATTGKRAAASCLQTPAALLTAGRRLDVRLRRELSAALDAALLSTIDALSARLLTDEVVDRALARVEQTGIAQRISERMLASGIAEQIAERALAGPETERMIATAFRGPLVEDAVAQLLESQAIWILVDEIARSPSVTEAIAHQSSGFLDQVAERLRDRSRVADTRVQELAERMRHARNREAGDPSAGEMRVLRHDRAAEANRQPGRLAQQ